ncbi:2,3-diketo-L-gulonate-binding periplasmic protein YiaO precursor [Marinomonas spartinae]|uniref:2,3-diketo-L-gulonate-binding periplasmic protein YiaO n=1 Tax=Marinomonas spartinae TaxID=1792290 RepID=A0A1A8TBT4_9GAMM|nr:TRAP transporter substrate-binding protein [Marinomonas spartinae]SBS29277.1 2,3-diketo-L-gulonate-binding periplasmic protein YiaO precursor [Marinomonas spartinae]
MRYSGLLLLSATLCQAPMVFAVTKFDFTNEYNATSIHAQGDQYFIDQVSKLTKGDVQITLHTGGSLGFKSADNFYAVSDDAVQIADTLAGSMAGIDPIFLVSSLPFLVKNEKQAEDLYKIAKPYYQKIFAKNGQILLYASPWPASGIWSKKTVTNKQELANLKIRTYDKNGTLTLRDAGADPIKLSWADVVPQLSTGGIQAVLTSADAGASGKFWEHLDNYSAIQYAIPLNMVHMNKDEFDDLPKKDQQAILKAAALTDKHNWQAVKTRVAENYKELVAHKVTIHKDLPKPFIHWLQESAKPSLKEWLKDTGQPGQTIIAEFEKSK